MPEKHSRPTGAGRAVWYTERLWRLAHDLPVQTIAVAAIPELDQDCWFGSSYLPTCRAVARHAQRIWDANLAYPIMLSADGELMDGGHQLAKAWLLGLPTIQAVQFTIDPEPDYIIPDDPSPKDATSNLLTQPNCLRLNVSHNDADLCHLRSAEWCVRHGVSPFTYHTFHCSFESNAVAPQTHPRLHGNQV